MNKQSLSKYLFPFFVFMAMFVLILIQWRDQNALRRGRDSPIYRDLMKQPAYVRKGFARSELQEIPDLGRSAFKGAEWVLFETQPLWIKDAPLPDMPKLGYFSPRRNITEEFTIIIPVAMDSGAIAYLDENPEILPGIYFASIGDTGICFPCDADGLFQHVC